MYHPSSMLIVAHTREAELEKEAQWCGLGRQQEETNHPLSRKLMVIGLSLATVAIVVVLGLRF